MPSPALLIPWLSVAAASLDCSDVQDPSERIICADAALTQQQTRLQRLYADALQTLPAAGRTPEAQQQESWQQGRAACPKDPDPRGCLGGQLARRIVERQISLRRAPVFAALTYRCPQASPASPGRACSRAVLGSKASGLPSIDPSGARAVCSNGARRPGARLQWRSTA